MRWCSFFAGSYRGKEFADDGSGKRQKGIQKKELVLAETHAQALGEKAGPEAPTNAKDFTFEGRPANALQKIDASENQEEDLNFSHSDCVVSSSEALPVSTRLR